MKYDGNLAGFEQIITFDEVAKVCANGPGDRGSSGRKLYLQINYSRRKWSWQSKFKFWT